jgi:hypothetical protein
VVVAARAGGTLVVVVGALGMAVVVMPVVAVADALAFRALAAMARELAADGMGEAVNRLAAAARTGQAANTLVAALRTGQLANTLAMAAGTGLAVNTLATVAVNRVSTAVVAMSTAIAHLTSRGISSMRVIRITLPIVATVAPVRGRNISARSKAVGTVVPVSPRVGFPPAVQVVNAIARAADVRADDGKFCCGGCKL